MDDVVRDIGVSHPIIYDTYDLCEYSRQDIMKRFNLKMLQNSHATNAAMKMELKPISSEF